MTPRATWHSQRQSRAPIFFSPVVSVKLNSQQTFKSNTRFVIFHILSQVHFGQCMGLEADLGREVKLGLAHPAVVGLRGGPPFQPKWTTPRTGVVALCPPRDPACGSQKSLLQRATSQHLSII